MTTCEQQAPDTVTLNSQWQGSAAKGKPHFREEQCNRNGLSLNRRAVTLLSPCEKLQTTPQ